MLEWQSLVLSVVAKITGSISCLASGYIVQHVLMSPKRRSKTYHRLLLGMSVNDMVGSAFGCIVGSSPLLMANQRACSTMAFLAQAGYLASPLYQGSLATFYLLMIVYGWKERRIRLIVEPWCHLLPNALGWGSAIAALCLKLYGFAHWTCWIGHTTNAQTTFLYRMLFRYALLWATIIYVSLVMWVVYVTVLTTEKASDKYQFRTVTISSSSAQGTRIRNENGKISGGNENGKISGGNAHNPNKRRRKSYYHPGSVSAIIGRKHSKSRRIANQACMYVCALILSTAFGTAVRVSEKQDEDPPFGLLLCLVIFTPLQGFYNMCIYLRPRYLLYRRAIHREMLRHENSVPMRTHHVVFKFFCHTFFNCVCSKRKTPADEEQGQVRRTTTGSRVTARRPLGSSVCTNDHDPRSSGIAAPVVTDDDSDFFSSATNRNGSLHNLSLAGRLRVTLRMEQQLASRVSHQIIPPRPLLPPPKDDSIFIEEAKSSLSVDHHKKQQHSNASLHDEHEMSDSSLHDELDLSLAFNDSGLCPSLSIDIAPVPTKDETLNITKDHLYWNVVKIHTAQPQRSRSSSNATAQRSTKLLEPQLSYKQQSSSNSYTSTEPLPRRGSLQFITTQKDSFFPSPRRQSLKHDTARSLSHQTPARLRSAHQKRPTSRLRPKS